MIIVQSFSLHRHQAHTISDRKLKVFLLQALCSAHAQKIKESNPAYAYHNKTLHLVIVSYSCIVGLGKFSSGSGQPLEKLC